MLTELIAVVALSEVRTFKVISTPWVAVSVRVRKNGINDTGVTTPAEITFGSSNTGELSGSRIISFMRLSVGRPSYSRSGDTKSEIR